MTMTALLLGACGVIATLLMTMSSKNVTLCIYGGRLQVVLSLL